MILFSVSIMEAQKTRVIETYPRIPKTIHLSHKSYSDLNPYLIPHLKRLHPDFEIKFYDDASALKLLPERLVTSYSKVIGAHRGDLIRYFLLNKFGGYWIDADNTPLINLYEISKGFDFVTAIHWENWWGYRETKGFSIHNGFLGSRPNNPILQDLLEHMISNQPTDHHFYVRYFYKYLKKLLGTTPLVDEIYEHNDLKMKFFLSECFTFEGHMGIQFVNESLPFLLESNKIKDWRRFRISEINRRPIFYNYTARKWTHKFHIQ